MTFAHTETARPEEKLAMMTSTCFKYSQVWRKLLHMYSTEEASKGIPKEHVLCHPWHTLLARRWPQANQRIVNKSKISEEAHGTF